MSLLNKARKTAQSFGLQINRENVGSSWQLRLPYFLANHHIENVIDVGADYGDFAVGLLEKGFRGRIFSFEPLPEAHQQLLQRALAFGCDRWIIGPQVALSDTEDQVEFFRAGNSVSSSLLKMTQIHVDAAPVSSVVGSFMVETRKLDDVLAQLGVSTSSYLKLDVQGAEMMVLKGAEQALVNFIDGIQAELSVDTLYDGQASDHDIKSFIENLGFSIWDLLPGFRNQNSMKLLQYDAVYFRHAS